MKFLQTQESRTGWKRDVEQAQQSGAWDYGAHLHESGEVKGKGSADLPQNLDHAFTICVFGCL